MRRAAIVLVALLAGLAGPPVGATPSAPPPPVVVAHIDTGINPYHEAFRDRSPRAQQHPSSYLPGYPKDTPALRLTLDAPTWRDAFEKDRKVWEGLRQEFAEQGGRMYWIPGTKIVGAVRLGAGGVYCPATEAVQPAFAAGLVNGGGCIDFPILDDHGHGTMTASRAAGRGSSLCEECLILSIEGLGPNGVVEAADAGWVDVQTNSWASLAPAPAYGLVDRGGVANLEDAASRMLVYFASGNGATGFLGFTPWPSPLVGTLVKGAIWVGAHDNGRVSAWSSPPSHLVADGFAGLAAPRNTVKGLVPTPFACCSSASAPYAASAGAAIVLEARRLLGDDRAGIRDGVVARGARGKVARGPLADGVFTLDELKSLVKHSAEAVPREGRHDGALHWLGAPGAPAALPYGPAANPYCPGCWTLPVPWASVPTQFPAYRLIGYGAANERSLDVARRVLGGTAAQPDRATVDAYFAEEARVRQAVHHPDDPGG